MKGDNVQWFNTRWEETIIAMKKQPDEEILYIIVSFNSHNSSGHCCRCTFKKAFVPFKVIARHPELIHNFCVVCTSRSVSLQRFTCEQFQYGNRRSFCKRSRACTGRQACYISALHPSTEKHNGPSENSATPLFVHLPQNAVSRFDLRVRP